MAINKKLIHFKKYETFKDEFDKGNILDTSICWIEDRQMIFTHQWGLQGVPEGGNPDLILTIDEDGNLVWSDPNCYTKEEIDTQHEIINTELEQKANIDLLSNVLGSEVVDELTFPDIHILTRDDLKKDLFDDMWLAAVGVWGKIERGHMEDGKLAEYYLNELYLTYEEALAVMAVGPLNTTAPASFLFCKVRTNLPRTLLPGRPGQTLPNYVGTGLFQSDYLEVINFGHINSIADESVYAFVTATTNVGTDRFLGGPKLRKTLGAVLLAGTSTIKAIGNCPLLEEIKIFWLGHDLDLSGCPKLNLYSVRYMFNSSRNSIPITITFHSDVYAKIITGEDDWEGLLSLAQSKNINIVSA